MQSTTHQNLNISNSTNNISYNVEIAPRPNKDKTYTLYLRITQNRSHKRIKLDVRISNKSQLNKNATFGKWIRQSNPEYLKLNSLIEREIAKAKEHQQELKESGFASPWSISKSLKAIDSSNFFEYAELRAKYFYDKGGYRNYKKYISFMKKLKSYINGDVLRFSEITLDFIQGFEAYLRKQPNTQNKELTLHHNTVARHLIVFKSIFNHAVINEKKIKTKDNPFLEYKIKEEAVTIKEKLSSEEISALEKLELPVDSPLWNCRNYFMFSFYCAGIRAGDLMLLKWCNITKEGRVEYKMSKTKKAKSLILLPPAQRILSFYAPKKRNPNQYIFPILDNDASFSIANNEDERSMLPADKQQLMYDKISSKNVVINKNLKKLAKMADIQKTLTFHISRHSFADIARKKGVNVYDIMNMLGHSSIDITSNYLSKLDIESMDKSMERVFE